MRFHRLDLNLLLVLEALAAERSVTRAARRLNLGQPALSAALSRLREHFGDPLFVPAGRDMVPTVLAQSLVEPVRELLTRAERVVHARVAFDPCSAVQRFVVSASDYTTTVLMPRVIGALATEAPDLHLSLRATPMPAGLAADPVIEALDRRRHDFTIVPRGFHSDRHGNQVLLEDGYSCIVRSDHPQVRDRVTARQFASLLHVVPEFDDGRVILMEAAALARVGLERRIGPVVEHFTMLGEVVALTDCIATLPSRHARLMAKRLPLRVLPLPRQVPPLVELLQWRSVHDHDPAAQWLRELMGRVAAAIDLP